MLSARLAQTLAWVSGTIFGREVVPEVCSTSATSSAAAWPGRAAAPAALAARRNAPAPGRASRRQRRSPGRRAFRPPSIAGDVLPASTTSALAAKIGQVELELVGAVGGIERRRGRAGGDAEEGGRHFRAVRQHDRDAVAAADPERRSATAIVSIDQLRATRRR